MTINFLLANAVLLKISVFIFFNKAYLQKLCCVMIEVTYIKQQNVAAVKICLRESI